MSDDKQSYESGMSEGHEDQGHGGNMAGHGQEPKRIPLTSEEIAVLKECNRESFWFRCLPLGLTFIATTQVLIMRGVLKPHPRYGSLLKNMGAGLAGYLVGKVSYQGKCREKILRLENSALADSIRKTRSWADNIPRSSSQGEESLSDEVSPPPQQSGTAQGSQGRLADSSSGPKEHKGLEENLRPSMDRDKYNRLPDQSSKEAQRFSYDSLRAKNRTEYNQRVSSDRSPSSQGSAEKTSDTVLSSSDMSVRGIAEESRPAGSQSTSGSATGGSKSVKRNQYGDIVES